MAAPPGVEGGRRGAVPVAAATAEAPVNKLAARAIEQTVRCKGKCGSYRIDRAAPKILVTRLLVTAGML
jgi:hypothetical protein